MTEFPIFDTLYKLRQEEVLILPLSVYGFLEGEQEILTTYLEDEYRKESADLPYQAPAFDAKTALWAAKIIFASAQYFLIGKPFFDLNTPPPTPKHSVASAILSADLLLRFLPDIISEIKNSNPQDPIIPILITILSDWHYSGIHCDELNSSKLDYQPILSDPCLTQAYVDRVILFKNKTIALQETITPYIKATLGDHHQVLWKELSL